jgi:sec-independent protein translocase protein TatB
MFDVGFSELLLTALVALLVIGPERLPKVARTIGLWTGRARRFVNQVKEDIDREIKAEELKRVMQEQVKSTGIHEIIEETRDTIDEAKRADYLVKAVPPATSSPEPTAENNTAPVVENKPAPTATPNVDDNQPKS